MKWQQASKIIKKAWEEKIEIDDGSYYKNIVKEIIGKRDLFLESADKFGTPQYILDEDVLKEKALFFKNTFKKYIPNSDFFYAFKSNDLPYLVNKLRLLGYGADVAGLFELKLALKVGFNKIIFTGPGKSIEELKLAIKNRDKVIINIDNEDELKNILNIIKNNKIKNKLKISLRINTNDKIMQGWSKFGIKLKDLKKIINKIKNNNKIDLTGLHFHSSWNDSPDRYCKNIKLIGDFLKNNLAEFEFLDIGGGIYPEDQATLTKFSHRYMLKEIIAEQQDKEIDFDFSKFSIDDVNSLDEFGKEILEYLEKYIFRFNKNIKIYFEPGRYISNNSTHILLKVIAEKGNNVIVDGGMNLIGGLDFSQYLFSPIVNISNPSLSLKKKIIYGSLCKADDLWGYSFFGNDCNKDDLLIVLMQGSYTFSRAWRLIKENAPYVVIKNNKLILTKEKEKFEERYSGCKF